MKKISKKHIVIGISILLLVSLSTLFILNNENKEKEPKVIETINSNGLETLIKTNKAHFVIFGESNSPSTKIMLESTLLRIDDIKHDVYYYDTSVFTNNLFNEDLKQDEKNWVIAEYTRFLDKYSVKTSPTMVLFKSKTKESLGKYIPDTYFETSKEKEQKQILQKANDNLFNWIFKSQ